MKNKNLILSSILVSCGIFACNNQVITNNVVSDSKISEKPAIILSSTPKITENNSPTPLPIPSRLGIIRTFIDNETRKNNSLLFEGNDLNLSSFIFYKNILYRKYGNYLSQLELGQSKSNLRTINCNDIIQDTDKNNICNYRGSRLKLGRNNIRYLFNNSSINKFDDNGLVNLYQSKEIYSKIRDFAVDKFSNVYLPISSGTIKKINPENQEQQLITKDNTTGEDFNTILLIEVDNKENIYIFDNSDLRIKKITPDGIVSTVIGGGSKNDLNILGKEYKFSDISIKFVIDNNNDIYITEKDKNRILKYDTKSNILSKFAEGGNNLASTLDITFDSDNNSYILDQGSKTIRKIDSKTNNVSIIASESLPDIDGTELSKVLFKNMSSIYYKNDNLYISESDRIRKINNYGVTTTIAGNGTTNPSSPPIYNPDILQADKSTVSRAIILYVDNENNIYISENAVIKKITPDNKIISFPLNLSSESVTKDSKGNLYFSLGTIKKVDKNNNVEIFAGNPAQYAQFFLSPVASATPISPSAKESKREPLQNGIKATEIYDLDPRNIVIDSKDNIYAVVNYSFNVFEPRNKHAIISISPDGIIKVLAGNDKEIINPRKMVIDKEDNLYFIDTVNNYSPTNFSYDLIKKIDNKGNMSIYAGKIPTSLVKSVIRDVNTNEAIFTNRSIFDITIDNNDFIYFLANDNNIYRIE